jgi:hypothetical protein
MHHSKKATNVRSGSFAPFWLCLDVRFAPTTTEWRKFENSRNLPQANSCTAAKAAFNHPVRIKQLTRLQYIPARIAYALTAQQNRTPAPSGQQDHNQADYQTKEAMPGDGINLVRPSPSDAKPLSDHF